MSDQKNYSMMMNEIISNLDISLHAPENVIV